MSDNNLPGLGRATEHLASSGLEELLIKMNDKSPDQRAAAARRLGELGESHAVAALLGRFTNDISPDVRLAAVDALAQIGDPSAWPVLERIFDNHQLPDPVKNTWSQSNSFEENAVVRQRVTEVLGGSNLTSTGLVLARALTDEEINVRKAAIQSISKVPPSDELIKALISGLSRLPKWEYKPEIFGAFECVRALIGLGPIVIIPELSSRPYGIEYPKDDKIFSLSDGKFTIDSKCLPWLTDRVDVLIGQGEALYPAIKLHDWDKSNEYDRIITIIALGNMRHSLAADILCGIAANDTSEKVRWFAVDSLAQFPVELTETHLQKLVKLLSFPSFIIRARAAYVLGKRRATSALMQLCDISIKDVDKVREEAIKALGEIADPRSLPVLGEILLNSRSMEDRRLAARAIGNFKSSQSLSFLQPAVFIDRDPKVRIACIEALDITDSRSRDLLKEILTTDKDEIVRKLVQTIRTIL